MMQTTINIIGAGRLGKTIGRLIAEKGQGTIVGVCNQTMRSAQDAVDFIGEGRATSTIADLPAADFVLIATGDAMIVECCAELAKHHNPTMVAHCSGVLSSSILKRADRGWAVGSIHPMRSFADPKISVQEFAGTYCSVDGDDIATKKLFQLFTALGAQCYEVKDDQKGLYHASAIFASNYVVALFDIAARGLERAGLDPKLASQIVLNLMEGTLHNLKVTSSSFKSITGPITRGDEEAVRLHMEALRHTPHADLYRNLAQATLDVAKSPAEVRERITSQLNVN
jgi:predicted short-subunit dehydrogenase-like oxidoreductase (DUF2520 family)